MNQRTISWLIASSAIAAVWLSGLRSTQFKRTIQFKRTVAHTIESMEPKVAK